MTHEHMRSRFWIREPDGTLRSTDVGGWGRWMETADRCVAKTEVGEAHVSTVFLGLDHSFGGPHPVLWETMVFGGPFGEYQDRYSSEDDAKRGHERIVACLRDGIDPAEDEFPL